MIREYNIRVVAGRSFTEDLRSSGISKVNPDYRPVYLAIVHYNLAHEGSFFMCLPVTLKVVIHG